MTALRPDDGKDRQAPLDNGQVSDLSPWDGNLADNLLMNKLLLWNQPHLLGTHAFPPPADETASWEWPDDAGVDPEG